MLIGKVHETIENELRETRQKPYSHPLGHKYILILQSSVRRKLATLPSVAIFMSYTIFRLLRRKLTSTARHFGELQNLQVAEEKANQRETHYKEQIKMLTVKPRRKLATLPSVGIFMNYTPFTGCRGES
jgi:hypothetical protein